MPTGKVKWYDTERAFGFLTRDDGGDVFVHKDALPAGVEALKPGARVEFGVAEGKRGEQALSVRVLEPLPSVAKTAGKATRPGRGPGRPDRKSPDELHALIEDMVQILDVIQADLRKGRYPDRPKAQQVAQIVRAVADQLEN